MPEPRESADNYWLKDLAERIQREIQAGVAPEAEKLTVRGFLAKFCFSRRGANIVSTIRSALESHKLRTTPDFEYAYIDATISIVPDEDAETSFADKSLNDPTVRIGILPAAHNRPERVSPDNLVVKATTLMRTKDYSQLPVMVGDHTVKGAISWRSLGEAYSNGRNPKTVKECMEYAHVVDTTATLVDATDEICKHDYVLVRGEKIGLPELLQQRTWQFSSTSSLGRFCLSAKSSNICAILHVTNSQKVSFLKLLTKEKKQVVRMI